MTNATVSQSSLETLAEALARIEREAFARGRTQRDTEIRGEQAKRIAELEAELAKLRAPIPDALKLTTEELAQLAETAALHPESPRFREELVPLVESLIAARVLKPLTEEEVGEAWDAHGKCDAYIATKWSLLKPGNRIHYTKVVNACRIGIGAPAEPARPVAGEHPLPWRVDGSDVVDANDQVVATCCEELDSATPRFIVERCNDPSPAPGAEMTEEEDERLWAHIVEWSEAQWGAEATGISEQLDAHVNAMLAKRVRPEPPTVTPPQPSGDAQKLTIEECVQLATLACRNLTDNDHYDALCFCVATLRAEAVAKAETERDEYKRRLETGKTLVDEMSARYQHQCNRLEAELETWLQLAEAHCGLASHGPARARIAQWIQERENWEAWCADMVNENPAPTRRLQNDAHSGRVALTKRLCAPPEPGCLTSSELQSLARQHLHPVVDRTGSGVAIRIEGVVEFGRAVVAAAGGGGS